MFRFADWSAGRVRRISHPMTPSLEPAALDADDSLGRFRERFERQAGVIYLAGNSLGPLPRASAERVAAMVRSEWGQSLVRGWNTHDWIGAPTRVGGKIAGLVGARADEVLVADSTSVNLYKLAVAAMQARPDRKVVLSAPGDFPTDLYMLEGAVRTLGGDRRLALAEGEALEAAITDDLALLVLCQTHYRSGAVRDMAALTAKAQAVGALVLWDLSHSTGVLDVDLNGCNADLAVGCGYKYLNGGPGAPAFLYVARRHQDALVSPLSGWFGHARPFAFEDGYDPAAGVGRFACGTPPMLSLAALEGGVDLALEATPAAAAAKARALGALFITRVGDVLELESPVEDARRGGHVAFRHPDAYAIVQCLIARGVIGDYREPDTMRFGLSPLPLSFTDVARAADLLVEVVRTRAYDDPVFRQRSRVT